MKKFSPVEKMDIVFTIQNNIPIIGFISEQGKANPL